MNFHILQLVIKKVTVVFSIIFFALIFSSCNKEKKWIDVDPAFSQYIDAYTSGVVSN